LNSKGELTKGKIEEMVPSWVLSAYQKLRNVERPIGPLSVNRYAVVNVTVATSNSSTVGTVAVK
jgi:hypothetical protein